MLYRRLDIAAKEVYSTDYNYSNYIEIRNEIAIFICTVSRENFSKYDEKNCKINIFYNKKELLLLFYLLRSTLLLLFNDIMYVCNYLDKKLVFTNDFTLSILNILRDLLLNE